MFGVDDLALILGAAKMVPKAWELVAGLFGKETPKTVVEAGKLIDQVETEISSGKVTPEQQLELKKVLLKDEQVKEQVELERLRLIYQDQAGGRDVIKTALMSDDPVVRQARPKMMLLLGKAGIAYTIVTPVVVGICALANVSKDLLDIITELILYQGLTLWAAFTTSFTGYTVARSADKRIMGNNDLETAPKVLGMLSKLGHKIS